MSNGGEGERGVGDPRTEERVIGGSFLPPWVSEGDNQRERRRCLVVWMVVGKT